MAQSVPRQPRFNVSGDLPPRPADIERVRGLLRSGPNTRRLLVEAARLTKTRALCAIDALIAADEICSDRAADEFILRIEGQAIDRLTPERRSKLMQNVKGRDTRPEKLVRSLLHRLGYRFRLHRKDLPGTPDIVFPRRRLALFVHGCYWHGHGCRIGRLPKSRLDYWGPKIQANRDRDLRKEELLVGGGWSVAVVWQCELAEMETLADRLRGLLDQS